MAPLQISGRPATLFQQHVTQSYKFPFPTRRGIRIFPPAFQWHLISSFYDYLPWKRCGVAVANTPWSGSYEVTSPLWSLAHTTQFAPIGWRYASHQAGVGLLSKGGSYVTRVSPDKKDFSIVVEKMSQENSHCARGNNPAYDTSPEQVVLVLKGSFLQAAGSSLRLWYDEHFYGGKAFVHEPLDSPTTRQADWLFMHGLPCANPAGHPRPSQVL